MNRIHHFALAELVVGSLNPTEVRSIDHPEIRSALHFIASNLENKLTIKDVADELHIVSARRTACCGHGYLLDFSGRVIGGKALFGGAVGGLGW
jgi:hypothetical protein